MMPVSPSIANASAPRTICTHCMVNRSAHRRGRSAAAARAYCRMPNSSRPQVANRANSIPAAKAYEYSPLPAGPNVRAITANNTKLSASVDARENDSHAALVRTLMLGSSRASLTEVSRNRCGSRPDGGELSRYVHCVNQYLVAGVDLLLPRSLGSVSRAAHADLSKCFLGRN